MKLAILYGAMMYPIACADGIDDETHDVFQRIIRVVFWPATLTSWFVSNNQRLHRLLTIGWTLLIFGWALSLMSDRLL